LKQAVDTNVLIYTHMPSLPSFERVRRYILTQLGDPDVTLIVTPLVLHEFVHVVTDPRRFDPPLTMSDALATARLYLGRSNVMCVGADEAAAVAAFNLLEQFQLGRKRIADTLLAATLARHEVRELITCNPSDFEVFDELTIVDPRKHIN
jgi:predicted nucleic acid-binding protein